MANSSAVSARKCHCAKAVAELRWSEEKPLTPAAFCQGPCSASAMTCARVDDLEWPELSRANGNHLIRMCARFASGGGRRVDADLSPPHTATSAATKTARTAARAVRLAPAPSLGTPY
ncbi:unnamed protein product [Heligmosomoides polygyrus]|uniref:DAN domain-containing protein n=1 Tax=Heligmosomoides polygyrus TaxID=6339 RepID=A0A183GEM1_HELPZ|nr:unnamed protein product [Heligmosomoides polygyrus]